MKSIALTLLILGCLLAVVCATPGKVYINGKCIDCNRPEDDDSVIIPMEPKSGVASHQLTAGAVAFGLIFCLFRNVLLN